VYKVLYPVILKLLCSLVILAGNLRDKKQGREAYMRRRIYNNIEREITHG